MFLHLGKGYSSARLISPTYICYITFSCQAYTPFSLSILYKMYLVSPGVYQKYKLATNKGKSSLP